MFLSKTTNNLAEDVLHDMSMHIGETEMAALVFVCKLLVIDTE